MMVWFQFSTTAYWYKLWGRISGNLPKGTYYLTINNSTVSLNIQTNFSFFVT